MIVKGDDEKSPEGQQLPPPYSLPTSPVPSTSTSTITSPISSPPLSTALLSSPPTNKLYIQRSHGGIKGKWAIDPTLAIPTSVLPQLPPGERRKHLSFDCKHGNINADINVIGDDDTRVELDFSSEHGNLFVKIRSPNPNRRLTIRCKAEYGNIYLMVPPTLIGPLNAHIQHGRLRFSSSVQPKLTTFTEVHGSFRGFLGDYASSEYSPKSPTSSGSSSGGGWTGSAVSVEVVHGNVKVSFVDGDETLGDARDAKWQRQFDGVVEDMRMREGPGLIGNIVKLVRLSLQRVVEEPGSSSRRSASISSSGKGAPSTVGSM